jgi:hypothetical protein
MRNHKHTDTKLHPWPADLHSIASSLHSSILSLHSIAPSLHSQFVSSLHFPDCFLVSVGVSLSYQFKSVVVPVTARSFSQFQSPFYSLAVSLSSHQWVKLSLTESFWVSSEALILSSISLTEAFNCIFVNLVVFIYHSFFLSMYVSKTLI